MAILEPCSNSLVKHTKTNKPYHASYNSYMYPHRSEGSDKYKVFDESVIVSKESFWYSESKFYKGKSDEDQNFLYLSRTELHTLPPNVRRNIRYIDNNMTHSSLLY